MRPSKKALNNQLHFSIVTHNEPISTYEVGVGIGEIPEGDEEVLEEVVLALLLGLLHPLCHHVEAAGLDDALLVVRAGGEDLDEPARGPEELLVVGLAEVVEEVLGRRAVPHGELGLGVLEAHHVQAVQDCGKGKKVDA